jgi:hypothetical protein
MAELRLTRLAHLGGSILLDGLPSVIFPVKETGLTPLERVQYRGADRLSTSGRCDKSH